jgi:hypothetical protein
MKLAKSITAREAIPRPRARNAGLDRLLKTIRMDMAAQSKELVIGSRSRYSISFYL